MEKKKKNTTPPRHFQLLPATIFFPHKRINALTSTHIVHTQSDVGEIQKAYSRKTHLISVSVITIIIATPLHRVKAWRKGREYNNWWWGGRGRYAIRINHNNSHSQSKHSTTRGCGIICNVKRRFCQTLIVNGKIRAGHYYDHREEPQIMLGFS